MSGLVADILEAQFAIANADSLGRIDEVATGLFLDLGAASLAYLMHRPPPGWSEDDMPHFGRHGDEWYRDYDRYARWRDDPAVSAVRNRITPFVWTTLDDGSLSPRERETLHSLMSDYGLHDGVTAPIHGPGPLAGVLSYFIDRALAEADRDNLKFAIAAIAPSVQERVAALCNAIHADRVAITPTQREIVQWTAWGKSSGDVAELMSINEVTVRRHLANARAEARCATTAQLVAWCVARNLVTA